MENDSFGAREEGETASGPGWILGQGLSASGEGEVRGNAPWFPVDVGDLDLVPFVLERVPDPQVRKVRCTDSRVLEAAEED